MRPTVGLEAHHVVRRDLSSEDGIVPVFQHEELVFVQHVGKAGDVANDKDGVGHHAINIEGATARVAADAPEAGGQPGPLQPFGVADRTERRQHHVTLHHAVVGESGTPHMALAVALQGLHSDPGTEVDTMVPLHLRGDRTNYAAERTNERCGAALHDRHGEA